MNKRQAAIVGFALAGTALLLAPLPATARWHGFPRAGLHRGHLYTPAAPWPFYGYGGYGGYVALPDYAPEIVSYAAPPVPIVMQAPRVLNCQRSREVVTVPAEAGGTREITVTRC